jgi:hypothetical protein
MPGCGDTGIPIGMVPCMPRYAATTTRDTDHTPCHAAAGECKSSTSHHRGDGGGQLGAQLQEAVHWLHAKHVGERQHVPQVRDEVSAPPLHELLSAKETLPCPQQNQRGVI